MMSVFAVMRVAAKLTPFVLAVVASAVIPPAAQARSTQPVAAASAALYVDDLAAKCSDSGPGTQAEPFCGIQAAANVVNPGQTVYLERRAFVIAQPLTIARSGTAAAPITFAPAPGISATELLPASAMPVITLKGVHDVILSGLVVDQAPGHAGIQVTGSSGVALERLTVNDYGNSVPAAGDVSGVGIVVDGASSAVTLSRVKVDATGGTGVLVRPGAKQVAVTASLISTDSGAGIDVDGAVSAILTSDTVNSNCGLPAEIVGGASATVENNIFATDESDYTDTPSCTAHGVALTVDSGSAPNVRADYNALYAGGDVSNYYSAGSWTSYSWAGTTYDWPPAGFTAATGQGAHDVQLLMPLVNVNAYQAIPITVPYEGLPVIDAADCSAPDEPGTDFYGHPRIDDPQVANTGNGTCLADIGAVERQDTIHCPYSVQETDGVAPVTASVEGLHVTDLTSWGQPGSCTVDFGDGSGQQPVTAATMTHSYTTPGMYSITVRGSAADGASESSSWQRAVVGTATPPKATLSWKPSGPATAGFTGSFGDENWEVGGATITSGNGQESVTYSGPQGIQPTASFAYRAPGSYTAALSGTDALGRATNTAKARVIIGDAYRGITPRRRYYKRIPAHGTVKLTKATLGGNYAPGIRGAFSYVTVSGAARAGTITVHPDGAPGRSATVLAFSPARTVSDSTLATPGSDGKVDFVNNSGGPVSLSVMPYGLDVTSLGWRNLDGYVPIRPVQVLSARQVGAGRAIGINVMGGRGLPHFQSDADVIEVTVWHTRAAGSLVGNSVHYVNWAAGQQVSKLVVVPGNQGDSGVPVTNTSGGGIVVSAAVVGYYTRWGTGFLPAGPGRVARLRIAPRHAVAVRIGGRYGLPATGIGAAMVSLTATSASRAGAITGWAAGTTRPAVPVLSYAKGTTAGAALISVTSNGSMEFYNSGAAAVTLTVTLAGAYYQGP